VRTRSNNTQLGVRNGNRWVVSETHADGALTVRNKSGQQVKLPAGYVQRWVELDYAATGDSAQGITAAQGVPVFRRGDGNQDGYSRNTRGRKAPVMVVVTGEDEDARDVLTSVIENDQRAKTATEMRWEIWREAQAWQARVAAEAAKQKGWGDNKNHGLGAMSAVQQEVARRAYEVWLRDQPEDQADYGLGAWVRWQQRVRAEARVNAQTEAPAVEPAPADEKTPQAEAAAQPSAPPPVSPAKEQRPTWWISMDEYQKLPLDEQWWTLVSQWKKLVDDYNKALPSLEEDPTLGGARAAFLAFGQSLRDHPEVVTALRERGAKQGGTLARVLAAKEPGQVIGDVIEKAETAMRQKLKLAAQREPAQQLETTQSRESEVDWL
jgi:hypothetical protein